MQNENDAECPCFKMIMIVPYTYVGICVCPLSVSLTNLYVHYNIFTYIVKEHSYRCALSSVVLVTTFNASCHHSHKD